jgi:hypothetical protein
LQASEPLPLLSPTLIGDWASRPVNVAGLAYFVLLLVSLASFAVPIGKDIPPFPWPRLLVWLPFALLSMLHLRLIPFFAVVAGPIMVLNFQDNLRGLGPATPGSTVRSVFVLARLVLGLALVAGLALDWPGWLHQWDSSYSQHRVAWSVYVDPSLRTAADRLDQLHKKGLLHNGLILGTDMAAYCSWFAPGVKGYLDTRFTLFAHNAETYTRMRREFDLKEWSRLAAEYDLNYVVAPTFKQIVFQSQKSSTIKLPPGQILAIRLWQGPENWPYLYGDGRTVIFGWTPQGPTSALAREAVDVNYLACGKTPEELRPPADGADFPTSDLSFWQNYASGKSVTPLATDAVPLYQLYYQVRSDWLQRFFTGMWYVSFMTPPLAVGAAAPAYLGAAAACGPGTLLPLVQSSEARPAAAQLLMMRSARVGVAAAPYNPTAFGFLTLACEALTNQENSWARPSRDLGRLRMVQEIAAMKTVVSLQPDNFRFHQLLAERYYRLHFLDLAQEHFALAIKYLDPNASNLTASQAKQAKQDKKKLQDESKRREADLKKRREEFDLRAKGLPPLRKAQLALRQPFKVVDALNKEQVDELGLGLAQKALTILQDIDTDKVKLNLQEKYLIASTQIELLTMMGRVKEAREALSVLKGLLGPGNDFVILTAAAVGDYAAADKALEIQIKDNNIDKKLPELHKAMWSSIAPSHCGPQLAVQVWSLYINQLVTATTLQTAAQLHFIRALMALEAGDNAAALRSFEETHRLIGTRVNFPDRPIVTRYMELLKREQKTH